MVMSVVCRRPLNVIRIPASRFLSCSARQCNQIWTPPGIGDKTATVPKNRSESKSENKLLNQVMYEWNMLITLLYITWANGITVNVISHQLMSYLLKGRNEIGRCIFSSHFSYFSTYWMSYDGSFVLTQIVGRIRFDGPMTVAQYMQELLTHPREGYYMHRLVLVR